MDPAHKVRFGYLVSLHGLGLSKPLARDLSLSTPYRSDGVDTRYAKLDVADGKVNVVGVIEHLHWGGGAGDEISIHAYVSETNAVRLRAIEAASDRGSVEIEGLGWIVVGYDQEKGGWFDEICPEQGEITGMIHRPPKDKARFGVASDVVSDPESSAGKVVGVYFDVVPAGDSAHFLRLATGRGKSFVRGWGLRVGS